MAMVKKSITLTDQQADWVQAQIASGHYASDSEVLRDLIRKEQTRRAEIEQIRAELLKAEALGLSNNSVDDIAKRVIQRKQKDGTL